MRMAERIPDVQQALDSGKSLDEIKQDPELKDTAHAYFDTENMIKVEQQANGSYSFADDGRHRITAAQELGYEIPVEVTNFPENANVSTADSTDMKPEGNTTPDDIANKSDISSETHENLGAFEQNKWDNLSQVEKEQAVEKLRITVNTWATLYRRIKSYVVCVAQKTLLVQQTVSNAVNLLLFRAPLVLLKTTTLLKSVPSVDLTSQRWIRLLSCCVKQNKSTLKRHWKKRNVL